MLRVRDAMSREVVTLGPEASAAEAWGVCQEMGIRHLPVVEKGNLVGLVSDRDLRDISPPRGSGGESDTLGWVCLRDMMSTTLRTIHPLDTIDHAARELHEHRIGCLPVVAEGQLVGIITSSDMMRILTELVGAHGRGSWVEVEVPNRPGALAHVTDVVRERQVNVSGVFLTPAPRASNRLVVLRLETTRPTGVVRSLEEAGMKVTTVESTSPLEPTLEEA